VLPRAPLLVVSTTYTVRDLLRPERASTSLTWNDRCAFAQDREGGNCWRTPWVSAVHDETARRPAATRAGERLPGIDGVRAIAALGVVVVHVGLISGYNMAPDHALGPYFARAEVGVSIFFVVSGFLIWRPFVAASLAGRPGPRVLPYLGRRLLRIVPLYWVALTVVLFVDHRSPVHGLGDLVTYYGFLQVYRPGYEVGGLQQAWSLCTIVSFYLLAPVLALGLRALCDRARASAAARLRVEGAVLVAVAAAGLAYRWVTVNDYVQGDPLSSDGRVNWLLTNADVFAVGMLLAVLHAWGGDRSGGWSAAVRGLGRVPAGAWWALAALCYWAVSVRLGLPLAVGAHDAREWMGREVLYTATSVFLLVPAMFGPQDRGLVRRFLRCPPMAWLGVLSYGIFVWHEWALDLWRDWRGLPPFTGSFPSMLAVTLGLSLLLALATWLVVERPAQALAARWAAAERGAPQPAPAPAVTGPARAPRPVAPPRGDLVLGRPPAVRAGRPDEWPSVPAPGVLSAPDEQWSDPVRPPVT